MKSSNKKRRNDDSFTSSAIKDAFDNIEITSEVQPNTIQNDESFDDYKPIPPQRGVSLPMTLVDNHSQSQIDSDVQMKGVIHKTTLEVEDEEEKQHNKQRTTMFGYGKNTQSQSQGVNIDLIIMYKKIHGDNALKMMEMDQAKQLKGMVGGARFGKPKEQIQDKDKYVLKSIQLTGKIQPTLPSYRPKQLPFFEKFKEATDHLLFLTATQISTRGCQICSGFGHGSQSCTTWMVLKSFGTGRSFIKNIIKEAKKSVVALIQLGPVHIDVWPLKALVSSHLRQCISFNQAQQSEHQKKMFNDATFFMETIEAQFTKLYQLRCNFCRGFGHVVYQNVKGSMVQCHTQTLVETNIQADSEATSEYLKWKQAKTSQLQTVFYQEGQQVSLDTLFADIDSKEQSKPIEADPNFLLIFEAIVGFVYHEAHSDYVAKFVTRCNNSFNQLEEEKLGKGQIEAEAIRKKQHLFQQAAIFMQNYEQLIKEWGKNKIKAASHLKFKNSDITIAEHKKVLQVTVVHDGQQIGPADLVTYMSTNLHFQIHTQMKKEILDDMGDPIDQQPLRIQDTLVKHFQKVLGDLKAWLEANAESSIVQYMGMG